MSKISYARVWKIEKPFFPRLNDLFNLFSFNRYIYPPDSQESDRGAIHNAFHHLTKLPADTATLQRLEIIR